ncbi:MAG: phosphoglycerate dehydrogenase [Chloracidobacterium sp.]|nr:phosphoglycerate dehydrogenase [Chloracidobacterium sp.]MDW8215989.1 phosphoglycerate dehydrogenase [Acidobacteriota bacterium]
MTTHRVLVCGSLAEDGLNILRSAPNITLDVKPELREDELAAVIAPYHALIVRSDTRPTAKVIAAAENLKVIGRAGTGVDNIDVEAATKRGIVVMNTPGGNSVTTAEHTFALLLATARPIAQGTLTLKAGRWERKKLVGVELSGKTLGIVGVGRIGSLVAQRAAAFGMHIIGYDPYLTREAAAKLGVELVTLDNLLARADFITLHVPLTEETRHIIGRNAFAKMKRGVRLVNCARGGLVDEAALAAALQDGTVAAAALDVFEEEPPPPDHPLLKLDNVTCTPHLGASTTEAQVSVAVSIAKQIVDFLENGVVFGAVNAPSVSAEIMAELRPYVDLGLRLGMFQGQAFGSNVRRLVIEYSGKVADLDVRPITQAVLVGLLSGTSDRVNFVNAALIAEERGMSVSETKNRVAKDFASLVSLWAETETGESDVAGAVFRESDLRIVRVNGVPIEAIPKGHMLLCANRDQPGTLGRICTTLGDGGVNIARLYLGRKEMGGTAISLIQVDSPVPDDVMAKLSELPAVLKARCIHL